MAFFLLLSAPLALAAQESAAPSEAPVVTKSGEASPEQSAPLVFLELFSSQACVFCPQADEALAQLIENKNVIGVACHVDYFDVGKGSLAQPFCQKRQSYYGAKLRSGPNYTPQMVINGAYDVVAYRQDDVLKSIRKAYKNPPLPIQIKTTDTAGVYEVLLPSVELNDPVNLRIVFFDKPHVIKIGEGGNKGKTVTYKDVMSRIERLITWDGKPDIVQIEVSLDEGDQGFAVIAQDMASAKIIAAGQFVKP
jgi:hypothetical protein